MKMTKRLLSLLLCLALLSGIVTNIGAGLFNASAKIDLSNNTAGERAVPRVSIVVPEAIYLKPGTATFDRYVGGGAVPAGDSSSTGTIRFELMDGVTVDEGTWIDIHYSNVASLNWSTVTTATPNASAERVIRGGEAVYSTQGSLITWEFLYTVQGVEYTSYAYTYVYASNNAQAGAQIAVKRAGDKWLGVQIYSDYGINSYGFITGIHSVGGGNYKSNFIYTEQRNTGNPRNTSPLYAHYTLGGWSGTSGYVPDGGAPNQGGASGWVMRSSDYEGLRSGIHTNSDYFIQQSGGGVRLKGYKEGGETNIAGETDAATAYITVDKSRYTNLSQIPYLSAGVMQFYYVQCVTIDMSSIVSLDGAITTGASVTDDNITRHDGNGYGLYHLSGSVPSESRSYVIEATQRYRQDGDSSSYIKLRTNLQVNIVDKETLRNTVLTWVNKGLQQMDYTTTKWNAYASALSAAARTLGDPTSTSNQIASAISTLNSKGNDLKNGRRQHTITVNHLLRAGGSSITVDGETYPVTNGYAVIPETKTFYAGATIHVQPNSYTGYNPPEYPNNEFWFYANDTVQDLNVSFVYTSAKWKANYIYSPEAAPGNNLNHDNYITNINIQQNRYKEVTFGLTYGSLVSPKMTGWTFGGWYLHYNPATGEYTDKVTSSTTVSTNAEHNLYAKWTCGFAGGHGSQYDPFLIETVDHLDYIDDEARVPKYAEGTYFKQIADINYNKTYNLIDEFHGSYDGDGHTITITGGFGGSEYAGFFGKLDNGAKVENLNVSLNGDIMANSTGTAGFIGRMKNSLVKNVHVTVNGNFLGASTVGAVVGYVEVTTSGNWGIQNSSAICNRNIRLYGGKNGTMLNSNNWVLVTKLPSDTSFDCGCNIMYIKSNDFIINGTATVVTSNGNLQFVATPNSGWAVEYRDGNNTILPSEYISENGTYVYIPSAGLTNARYYIYFVKEIQIVGRNTKGAASPVGGTVSPQTARLEQGESIELSATPARGYNFAGWEINGDQNQNIGYITGATSATGATFTMGEIEVQVIANFKPSEYLIKFDANAPEGGAVSNMPENISAIFGETYTIPSNVPTRVGWTFITWAESSDGNTGSRHAPNSTVTSLSDQDGDVVTLYALWEHNTFDITFVANGAPNLEYSKIPSAVHGSTFTFPNTSWVGHTFYGWFEDPDFVHGNSYPIGATETVTCEMTYYAYWRANTYIVAFDAKGGTGAPESITATYGVSFSIPTQIPTRTGYTFLGWDNRSVGVEVVYEPSDLITDNMGTTGADPQGGQTPTLTLYAVWEAQTFETVWRANGGIWTATAETEIFIDVVYGQLFASYMPQQEPTKNGFAFAGWFTAAEGGTQIKSNTVVEVTANGTVFYAHWDQKTYTLRFDKNNVDAVYIGDDPSGDMPDVVINFSEAFTMPFCDYDRDGFTFEGWSLTSTAEPAYYEGESYTDIAANNGEVITLFAQWSANKYRILFNGNGNTSGSTQAQEVYFGETVTLNANGFVKAGSVFVGWAVTQADATRGVYKYGDEAPFTMQTKNITLYAVWGANQYKIIFHGSGATGGAMGGQLMAYGATETLFKNAFLKNGYHFIGWAETENSNSVSYADEAQYTMLSESDKDLYAVWDRNSYTLVFDGNAPDAEHVASPRTLYFDVAFTMVLTSGSSATVPFPSRPGYNFAGWSDVPGLTATYPINDTYTLMNLTSEENGTATLYAIWEPRQIGVNWDCWGGAINGQVTIMTYPVFGQNIVFPSSVPTRQGYVFDNWWDDPYEGDQILGDMVINTDEELTFYAHWTASTYTVVYNKNADDATGETAPTTHTCDVPDTLATCGFTRPGYRFVMWNTMPDGSGAEYYGNGVVKYKNLTLSNGAEVTLYAMWERLDVGFTVKLMCQNEERTDYTIEYRSTPYTCQADTVVWASAYSGAAIPGFTWNEIDYSVKVNGDGSTILYVYYNRNTYTVTYHSNDGYDDTYTQFFFHGVAQNIIPVSFRRIGYEFDHWASRIDGSGTVYANNQENVMFSSNTDLYAQWRHTSSPYTVYHYVQSVSGGFPESAKTVQTLEATSLSVVNAQPMEIEGFEWDETVAGTVSSGLVTVDGSLILKLYYVRQTYDIILDPNGGVGDEVTITNARYGETKRLPSVATLGYSLPGYAFAGWATTPTGDPIYLDNSSYIVGAGEQRLFARWQTGLYTITFNSNGGSPVSPLIAAYGAVISAPQPDPIKAGFVFRAWTLNGDDYEFSTMPREDITLVADWLPDSVTVTFDASSATSGTVPDPITGQYGNSFEMPDANLIYSDSENEEYRRLVGWSTTEDSATGTLVGENTAFPANSVTLYPVWSANYYEFNLTIDKTQSSLLPASFTKDSAYSSIGQYASLGSPAGWYPRDYFTDASIENLEEAAETAQLPRNMRFAQANQENLDAVVEDVNTAYNNIELKELSTDMDVVCSKTPDGNDYPPCSGFHSFNELSASAERAINSGYYTSTSVSQLRNRLTTTTRQIERLGSNVKYPHYDSFVSIIRTLENQYHSLVLLKASFTEFENLYASVNRNNLYLYTDESVANMDNYYTEKIAEKNVITKPYQYIVDGYVIQLQAYIDALEPKEADYSAVLMQFKRIPPGYTDADLAYYNGWETFNEAYLRSIYTVASVEALRMAVENIDWTLTIADQMLVSGEEGSYEYIIRDAIDNLTLLTASYTVNHHVQNANDNAYTIDETANIQSIDGAVVTATAKNIQGFHLNEDSSVVSGTVSSTQPLVLDLYYDRNEYTITFETNGGGTIAPMTARYGAAIAAPTDPEKLGSVFDGWYTDANFVNAFVFSTMPLNGATLYAKWTENIFNIDFMFNDGTDTVYRTLSFNEGFNTSAPTQAPTRAGYDFDGWYDDAACTGEAHVFGVMGNSNIAVYAKWIPKTNTPYSIIHNTETINGDFVVHSTEDLTGTTGATVTATPLTNMTGFELDTDASTLSTTIAGTGDTVLNLYYVRSTYKITFNTNGGSEIAEQFNKFGKVISAPANPTKTGYVFGGWQRNGSVFIFSTMPAEDIILDATWTPATNTPYTVKRYTQDTDLTGYTEYSSDTLTGTTEATVTANMPPIPGFELDETMGTRSGTVQPDGSLTLTLYYTRKSFTISFNSAGGSPVNAITQLYGTVVAAPEDPQYPGYTFVKWQTESGQDYTFTTMPAEDIELTAVWATSDDTPYTVEYYLENVDGSFTKDDTVTLSGKTNSTVYAEERTYTGFELSADASTPSGTVLPSGDLVLVMKYVRSQFTIMFNTDGGSAVAPITAKYGAPISAPANPTKRGSIFNGWQTLSGEAYTFTTMPAENITLKAVWALDPNTPYSVEYYWQDVGSSTYTLHETVELSGESGSRVTAEIKTYEGFECDTYSSYLSGNIASNGSLTLRVYYYRNYYTITFIVEALGYYEEMTYEYGANVTPVEEPEPPAGYVFSGWNNVPATMPAEDMEIYGTFDLITYSVTYYVDNEVFAVRNYAPSIEIPALDVTPTKLGNTFSRWDGLPRYMPSENIEVTAVFVPQDYHIYYKVDGEDFTNQTYHYEDTITAPANVPTKTGHTFVRWNGLPETMPANDITVTAVFAVNTYYINYVIDGEAYGEPQAVIYNTAVTAIADPSRTGYIFDGWQDVPEIMPDHDVTVTGSFTAIDYTVKYYIDGEYYNEQTWHYGDTITAIDPPVRTGYEFSGWQNLPETMPAENVISTGVFTIKSYKVFYVVDGEPYGEQTYEYNTQVRAMAVPAEREGYTFSGWSEIPELMPAENVTVTGTFVPKQYKVTFNVDGQKYDETLVAYGTAITLPTDPEKTGYQFNGWKNIPETMPAEDIVLEADFTVKAFTITYLVDGEDYDTQTCNYGATVIPITEPSARVGYTFSGWQNVPETMPAEDVTVTGTFTAKMYTVTFMNEGEVYAEIDSAYDTEPTVPQENPFKEGYTFRGWYGLPEKMPANNITVTADYIVNSYSIFYYVGSELYKTQLYNYGAEITPAEYPDEREGYTFSGWNNLPETMPAQDLQITGSYAPNIYRVTYYLDGEIYDTYTRIYGAPLTQLADPEPRVGYTFSGWTEIPETMPAEDVIVSGSFLANTYQIFYFLDNEPYDASSYKFGAEVTPIDAPPEKTGYTFGGWQDVPETMPDHNVNVYGVYNVNSYNVNFYIDEEYDSNMPVNYGADIVITYVPTKEGHEFSGWSIPNGEIPATMPAEDVNVYGTFAPLSYKVTYMSEGEYYGEEMFVFDTYVVPTITEPTKTGYRFQSWSGLPEKMPAEEVTATAVFAIMTYKVTYFVDGEQYGEAEEYTYQTAVTPREEPEARKGYTFSGWSEIPEIMPAYDVNVVGSFTKTTYTVTYYVDNTYYTAQPYHYGDTITPASDPTMEGCTFSGWTGFPEDMKMPDESIEVTGSFVPNEYNIIYKIDGEVYKTVPCTYTHQVIAIDAPAREGYDFDGWAGLPEVMPAHDVEVTGSYTIARFKILYYVDNEFYGEDEFEFMSAVTPRAPLGNKPGYIFSGWSDIPEVMPSYDVEVFGEYIADSFTITYMMDGNEYAVQTYASGETVVPPTAPTAPEGYIFAGWAGLPAVMPIRNITVSGSFKKGIFKITYYVDGEFYADESYEYQQAVTPLPIPGSRTGFDFSGWTDIPETMPGSNVSIYGNYVAKTYEINYYIDGVKVGTTYHAYGSTISPLADQQRTGHTFNGWVGLPDDMKMPAEDVNVTGSFTINQYTITYVVDGETYTTQTYDYNAAVTAPTEPTKAGFEFSGWIDLPARMPAEDITIAGSFERNKALVSFSLNNGTGTVPASVYDTVGTEITLPDQGDIYRTGYEFLGWSTKRDADASDVLTSFVIPENGTTLYAVWSAIQIELIARDGSGTFIDNERGLIYGVEASISRQRLLSDFIDVLGNGTIRVESASARRVGTGTIITLCDADGSAIKEYYLVVFGDVDGDGLITAADITEANKGLTEGFELDCFTVAANVSMLRKNDKFNQQDITEMNYMFNEAGFDQEELAYTLAMFSGLI